MKHINKLIKFLYKIKLIRIIFYKFLQKKKYRNFIGLKIDQNSIVLDLGANIGDISQCILDLYNCNIYCYEPNNNVFKVLKKRFKNYEKIIPINKSVGNKNKKTILYYHKKNDENPIKHSTGSSLLSQKENINKNNHQITEMISIREILNQFDYIDLIKIDIEGYEYNILPEIIKNKNKIGKVICELHGSSTIKNKFLNNKYLEIIKILNTIDKENKWFKYHH
jgi:FkbM family methyltransferase